MDAPRTSRAVARWLIAACGVWLVGLGFYFVFLRPPLLPEDPRFMGVPPEVLAALPGLARWLGKVFTVMGGFMAGCGVLVLFLARRAVPAGLPGTTAALALAGVVTVGVMSGVNFALHSDFRWLLAVPPLLWAAGVVLHARRPR